MGEAIKTKVTEQGVLIPRTLLQGIEEVEIRKEDNIIVIIPTSQADPILELGKHPVACGIADASEHHDKYLYNSSP
jgi:virulence-associated protein VagC